MPRIHITQVDLTGALINLRIGTLGLHTAGPRHTAITLRYNTLVPLVTPIIRQSVCEHTHYNLAHAIHIIQTSLQVSLDILV